MSFRFDNCKPENFNLIHLKNNIYLSKDDNTKWEKINLYDFGWGSECGYMKLPKLEFNKLWKLLISSNIQDNVYGAAYIIEKDYPDQLLKKVNTLLNNQELINKKILNIFEILKLNKIKNRSSIIGKSSKEIKNDFKRWKDLSKKVKEIL